jgi:hypothetical protein
METDARLSSLGREVPMGPGALGGTHLKPRVTVALLLAVPIGALTASFLSGAAGAEALVTPLTMLSVPVVALAWGALCFLIAREVEDEKGRALEAALSGATVVLGTWLMTFFSFVNG